MEATSIGSSKNNAGSTSVEVTSMCGGGGSSSGDGSGPREPIAFTEADSSVHQSKFVPAMNYT